MAITLIDALNELGISAYCKDNDYDTIVWTNPEQAVSKEVLDAKVAEMQSAMDAIQYKNDRAKEYPSLQECIHALLDGGDTLTNLQSERAKVKAKYPKPE